MYIIKYLFIIIFGTLTLQCQSAYSYEKIISTGTEGHNVIIKEDEEEVKPKEETPPQTIIYTQNNYYNTHPEYVYKYVFRGFVPNQVLFGRMQPPPPKIRPDENNNSSHFKPQKLQEKAPPKNFTGRPPVKKQISNVNIKVNSGEIKNSSQI